VTEEQKQDAIASLNIIAAVAGKAARDLMLNRNWPGDLKKMVESIAVQLEDVRRVMGSDR
jgi:hypothetical protein